MNALNGFVPPEEQILLAGDSDLNGALVPIDLQWIFLRSWLRPYQGDGLPPRFWSDSNADVA
jgi:hypothetical protein